MLSPRSRPRHARRHRSRWARFADGQRSMSTILAGTRRGAGAPGHRHRRAARHEGAACPRARPVPPRHPESVDADARYTATVMATGKNGVTAGLVAGDPPRSRHAAPDGAGALLCPAHAFKCSRRDLTRRQTKTGGTFSGPRAMKRLSVPRALDLATAKVRGS